MSNQTPNNAQKKTASSINFDSEAGRDALQIIQDAIKAKNAIQAAREKGLLVDGIDFGIIPNTEKPTLLKPGAEKLCKMFGVYVDVAFDESMITEQWGWEGEKPPFVAYTIKTYLYDIETGKRVGVGVGSCNSMEVKYRYRWVTEEAVPPQLELKKLEQRGGSIKVADWQLKKRETGGKYGKPESYWKAFDEAISAGTAKITKEPNKNRPHEMDTVYEISNVVYRIPNDEIASVANTVLKIAVKRSTIEAVLRYTGASEIFTQDVEDMIGYGIDDTGYDVSGLQREEASSLPSAAKTKPAEQTSNRPATPFAPGNNKRLDTKAPSRYAPTESPASSSPEAPRHTEAPTPAPAEHLQHEQADPSLQTSQEMIDRMNGAASLLEDSSAPVEIFAPQDGEIVPVVISEIRADLKVEGNKTTIFYALKARRVGAPQYEKSIVGYVFGRDEFRKKRWISPEDGNRALCDQLDKNNTKQYTKGLDIPASFVVQVSDDGRIFYNLHELIENEGEYIGNNTTIVA